MPIYNVQIEERIVTTHRVEAANEVEAEDKGLNAFLQADQASYQGVNVEERAVSVEEVRQ